jgi:hypothetical protein
VASPEPTGSAPDELPANEGQSTAVTTAPSSAADDDCSAADVPGRSGNARGHRGDRNEDCDSD